MNKYLEGSIEKITEFNADEYDLEEEDRLWRMGEVPNHPTLIVSIPTLLDSSLAPSGQHHIKVLVTVPYHHQDEWGRGDAEKYHRIKEEFSQRILQQLEAKLIPDLWMWNFGFVSKFEIRISNFY